LVEQASSLLQVVPSALGGLEQIPVAGSQTPASWHWSSAAHVTAFVVPQIPETQVAVKHLLDGTGQSDAATQRHR
jgi:hypothetical protein